MCGICGEFRFDGSSPDLAITQRMMQRLEKRGPDHGGSFSDGPVALGHRRLSIIDLSVNAHQPMIDRQHALALVFNGTIYNFPQLRAELQQKGHHFNSSGDSEVILKAYAEWGEHCVERFSGMFAFALWDMNAKSLFLARDRFGIKPLYYSLDNKRLRFASSVQALLEGADIDTEINPIGLHNQFTLHGVIPAPNTLLNGVQKFKPAHQMRVKLDGRSAEKRYWQLDLHPTDSPKSEGEWIEAIHASLRSAVKKRLDIADVPVGVLLSGGLDSSLLVGLLAEAGVSDLKTFTVGFDDQPEEKGNEFEFSDPVAETFGTEHHKFHVPNKQLIERLPEAVDAMNEPMFGQDAIAFYLLSEQVSKKVKVVQSGQGADEVFAGYFWYPEMAKASGSDLERFAPHYFDRDHAEWLTSVQKKYHCDDATSPLIAKLLADLPGDDYLNRVLAMDTSTLIVDDPVKRVDNMTMAWGLEARVPFLDHELVQLATQMPSAMKLQSGGKHVLKKIARGLLPDSVIDRRKGYFPVPALKYVRGEVFDFVRDILTSDGCRQRALFEPKYVAKLLANPERYLTRLQGSKLWHMALLELWLQRNVDRAA
ncbi:MAG: N-acetylglutaminylglutamine amidotransferase [Gammaproteobacteria bacterium]|nr:N-acetylglutaminylglutamine amidotransferase [Gammaproteobacteria bacterium]